MSESQNPSSRWNLINAMRKTKAFSQTNDPYKKSEKEQKMKKRWKFVRDNTDIIIKPTVIETLHTEKFKNISDIPTVLDIANRLWSENKTRGRILKIRRDALLRGKKIDDKHFKEAVDRQILAQKVEELKYDVLAKDKNRE